MSAKAIFSKWYSASSTPDRERDRYEDGREMGVEEGSGEAGDGWEDRRKRKKRRDEGESETMEEDIEAGKWVIEGEQVKKKDAQGLAEKGKN